MIMSFFRRFQTLEAGSVGQSGSATREPDVVIGAWSRLRRYMKIDLIATGRQCSPRAHCAESQFSFVKCQFTSGIPRIQPGVPNQRHRKRNGTELVTS